jgi:aryl-alcohol dehydrogenase-like predicted oxidoreductase
LSPSRRLLGTRSDTEEITEMKYRNLGKTGIRVSELGFGGWGIGGAWWSGSDDRESEESLELAKKLGITLFDSALQYGDGHSEMLIGKAIAGERDSYVITSKVPPKNYVYPPVPGSPVEEAFPADWIVACTERSLKNFGVDYLDLQQFHVWVNSWGESEELVRAVEKLKQDGKVKAFGCSVNFPFEAADNAVPAMRAGLFDTIQIVYNIYEQEPEAEVLRVAKECGVGVIARCPLDEGALTGAVKPDSVFPEGSFLDTYFKGDRKQVVFDKAQELNWLIEEGYAESLAEAAVRFVLSHEAVSTAIVGMRKARHAQANCAAVDKGPLPEAALQRLKKHAWPHNFWM